MLRCQAAGAHPLAAAQHRCLLPYPAISMLLHRCGGSTQEDRFHYWKRSSFIRAVAIRGDTCPLLATIVWSQPMG